MRKENGFKYMFSIFWNNECTGRDLICFALHFSIIYTDNLALIKIFFVDFCS